MNANSKKWIILFVLLLAGGLLLLVGAGNLLISEVTEDVELAERTDVRTEPRTFVGALAPEFTLEDIAGNVVPLSRYHGEALVLTFWTSWNAMSVDHLSFLDGYARTGDSGLFTIVAVNSQEPKEAVGAIVRRQEYILPILLDTTGAVSERYGITTLPVTYFIDKDGIVRKSVVGPLNKETLLMHAESLFSQAPE